MLLIIFLTIRTLYFPILLVSIVIVDALEVLFEIDSCNLDVVCFEVVLHELGNANTYSFIKILIVLDQLLLFGFEFLYFLCLDTQYSKLFFCSIFHIIELFSLQLIFLSLFSDISLGDNSHSEFLPFLYLIIKLVLLVAYLYFHFPKITPILSQPAYLNFLQSSLQRH